MANLLKDKGIAKGDRVAVLSDNRPEYLEVFFGCATIGAVITPISWRLAEAEIAWQIQDSDPLLVIAAPEWEAAARSASDREVLVMGRSYESALAAADEAPCEDISTFDDPLMILYTSGTTGTPKGAVLTHGNFFFANLNMIVASDIREDDVSLMFLPMFHIGGWNVNLLSIFLKGGCVVLERGFDPQRCIDLIAKKKVTWLMGVPATYLFMSQQPGFASADLSSVRVMVVGGAPMPEVLLKEYQQKGINIVQGYGLTELAPNALLLPSQEVEGRLGSAGKPYFFTDTQLMDDEGKILDAPATGEIVARGPVVMQGYRGRPDATAETIRDGWLHTGDVGRTDAEGFFYIVDRKKDMVITGGENVYPAEIENVLYEHPDIAEAAVIGIPDAKWGETVHAIVVVKEGSTLTEDSVITHCASKLAKFKVPRTVQIRSEALPRTPAGKVRKPELREPFWEGHGKNI